MVAQLKAASPSWMTKSLPHSEKVSLRRLGQSLKILAFPSQSALGCGSAHFPALTYIGVLHGGSRSHNCCCRILQLLCTSTARFRERESSRQQWSAVLVPLMWAAAGGNCECHVLQWLVWITEHIHLEQEPSCNNKKRHPQSGRSCTRQCVPDGTREWIHEQGSPRPRCRAHFTWRAQERLTNL